MKANSFGAFSHCVKTICDAQRQYPMQKHFTGSFRLGCL